MKRKNKSKRRLFSLGKRLLIAKIGVGEKIAHLLLPIHSNLLYKGDGY